MSIEIVDYKYHIFIKTDDPSCIKRYIELIEDKVKEGYTHGISGTIFPRRNDPYDSINNPNPITFFKVLMKPKNKI